jgi:electron-transferring-flavoprotein dehydrogenase
VVARPSGLYGPGRSWLWRRALSGEPGDGRWTNRIHVDDAAAALAELLDLPSPQACYCLNDDAPSPEHVVLNGLRALRGLPAIAPASTQPRGRRVSNALLRGSGWAPCYPSWREGYAREAGSEH